MAAAPDLEASIAVLRAGGLVAYPTETLYGLGARALDAAAVDGVVDIKGRDESSPIALIASDVAMVDQVVSEVPPAAERLMAEFWPGPLTLVLPARATLPRPLAPRGTIGVRVSAHPVARALAAGVGEPITATSANPSGAPAPARLDEVRAYFGDRLGAYVDGGTLAGGLPSTVVIIAADAVRVVRSGAVPVEAIRHVLGDLPIELPEQ